MVHSLQSAESIVLTGPESTGKTTLSSLLSLGYDEPLVSEMSRPYLEARNGEYAYQDLAKIASVQLDEEKKKRSNATNFLFCDTDLLTIVTWGKFKYGKIDEWIEEAFYRNKSTYVLCDIDVPWEPDPLRENPNDRRALFDLHLDYLKESGKQHIVVKGKIEERIQSITAFLDTKNL